MITRKGYLGIKLSKSEEKALISRAKTEGLRKSVWARRVLRMELINTGTIKIYNPAPQSEMQEVSD